MNYGQTLDYLYNALPMFSRMGSAAYKKDLTNIHLLCERLDHPERRFRSIHVAGTNGKGSVSHMLAAVYAARGLRTGLYTSPHLYDFRERIRVNGAMIAEDFIVDFVQRMQPAIEAIEPSFFEITVAMAFDYFVREQVDLAIVEVGLGGRLDSTNIITPELSVITNIGWDHMNLLGDSLPAIAAEKGGIIKPGVPVVIGERKPETESVFRTLAEARKAPLHFAEDHFQTKDFRLGTEGIRIELRDLPENRTLCYDLDLGGIYQTRNLATVATALSVQGIDPDDETVHAALSHVKEKTGLGGRWEYLQRRPDVVLEVAHNREGLEQMALHLSKLSFDNLHLILGFVRDKDIGPALSVLPKHARYYFTQAHIPRALEAQSLQQQAEEAGLTGETYEDVNEALSEARSRAGKKDLIIVCGSIFLVAEVDRASKGQPA